MYDFATDFGDLADSALGQEPWRRRQIVFALRFPSLALTIVS